MFWWKGFWETRENKLCQLPHQCSKIFKEFNNQHLAFGQKCSKKSLLLIAEGGVLKPFLCSLD